jgi:hypothetical protein
MIATITALIGGIASVALMLYTGRHNASRLLLTLFALWVISPFAILVFANTLSAPWSKATITTLALVLSSVTLAIYGYTAFLPSHPQGAFAFVAFPPVSWLLIAIVLLISRRLRSQPEL